MNSAISKNRVKVKTSPKYYIQSSDHTLMQNVSTKREILFYFRRNKVYFNKNFNFFTQNLIDKDQENKFDTIVCV